MRGDYNLFEHSYFIRKGSIPQEPEQFPPKVPNSPPYEMFHNPLLHPITSRDLEYRAPSGLTLPPRKVIHIWCVNSDVLVRYFTDSSINNMDYSLRYIRADEVILHNLSNRNYYLIIWRCFPKFSILYLWVYLYIYSYP